MFDDQTLMLRSLQNMKEPMPVKKTLPSSSRVLIGLPMGMDKACNLHN